MGKSTEDRSLSAISERAAEWYVMQHDAGFTNADRQQFVAWLQASPLHVQEYLLIAAAAQDLAGLPAMPEPALRDLLGAAQQENQVSDNNVVSLRDRLPGLTTIAPARDVSAGWWRALAATVTLAAGLLMGWLQFGWFNQGQRYEVTDAGPGVWRLSDGSVMHLNTDTTARVFFSRNERLVELQHGEAMFEVSHHSQRPFRVVTRVGEVVAVGTRFDVRVERQCVQACARVTVMEGRVLVGPAASASSGQQQLTRVALVRGQQLSITADGAVGGPVAVWPRDFLAWIRRDIVFDQQPLATLAEEFSRYTVLPIQIDDPTLAAMRVSGVFNAYDSESFLQFLRGMAGVQVTVGEQRVHVSRHNVQAAVSANGMASVVGTMTEAAAG